MKKVIINGDDFGLNPEVNRGIIRAFREGILTSASIMVNMPGFEDALNLLKKNPLLDIGLHVNIFRGKPVLPDYKTKTFTDKRGFFLQSALKIVKRIYLKQFDFMRLEEECEAQIIKALDRGINITHIDSEKHLHFIKPIYKIITKLGLKYGVINIRNINEFPYLTKSFLNLRYIFNSNLYKVFLLQFLSNRIKKINFLNPDIYTPDYSFGILESGCMDIRKYRELFIYLKDGVTEIICHPQETGLELSALLDPELKILMKSRSICLANYANIKKL